MEIYRSGTLVPLTAHEFKLLRYFLDNPGRAIAREELLSDVWGMSFHLTTRTVDNQILKLRQKLETDPANPVHFAPFMESDTNSSPRDKTICAVKEIVDS